MACGRPEGRGRTDPWLPARRVCRWTVYEETVNLWVHDGFVAEVSGETCEMRGKEKPTAYRENGGPAWEIHRLLAPRYLSSRVFPFGEDLDASR